MSGRSTSPIAHRPNTDITQSYATAGFGQHSMLATVSTVRSIVAAASQPAYAKISDVFGRISILVFCTVIYVIGESLAFSSPGSRSLVYFADV